MTLMTPYQCSKIFNQVLNEAGLENKPPQMLYNYVSKSMIPSTEIEGKKRVAVEDLQKWIVKFMKKNYNIQINFESEIDEDLQKELDQDEEILKSLEK